MYKMPCERGDLAGCRHAHGWMNMIRVWFQHDIDNTFCAMEMIPIFLFWRFFFPKKTCFTMCLAPCPVHFSQPTTGLGLGLQGFMAAAKFDGPMEYPVEGYLPVGPMKPRSALTSPFFVSQGRWLPISSSFPAFRLLDVFPRFMFCHGQPNLGNFCHDLGNRKIHPWGTHGYDDVTGCPFRDGKNPNAFILLAVHMKVRLSYFQVDRSESSKKVTIVFPYLWVNYNDTATEPWNHG